MPDLRISGLSGPVAAQRSPGDTPRFSQPSRSGLSYNDGERLLSLNVANYVRVRWDTGSSERTVVDTYPHEAWRRLGVALERRRGELGYGYRQRGQFVRDRSAGMISIKTISRLEKGERSS